MHFGQTLRWRECTVQSKTMLKIYQLALGQEVSGSQWSKASHCAMQNWKQKCSSEIHASSSDRLTHFKISKCNIEKARQCQYNNTQKCSNVVCTFLTHSMHMHNWKRAHAQVKACKCSNEIMRMLKWKHHTADRRAGIASPDATCLPT